MQRSKKILLGVGAGVLTLAAAVAIAGPVLYREFLTPPAADVPSLAGSEQIMGATGTPLDPAQLAGEWRIASGSEAGYRVGEVLNGTDVTVTGRTQDVTGTFHIGSSGLTLDSAELTVDVASITTDSDSRDAYFREDALRVAEFPEATFTLSSPVALESIPDAGSTVKTSAAGELTIAGKTQQVTAEVQVRSDGTVAEIVGSIPITFEDFGVTAPSLGFVSVEPEGLVEFDLVAEPAR